MFLSVHRFVLLSLAASSALFVLSGQISQTIDTITLPEITSLLLGFRLSSNKDVCPTRYNFTQNEKVEFSKHKALRKAGFQTTFVTARQQSWGKVMFSVMFVCQSFCPQRWEVLCDHYP